MGSLIKNPRVRYLLAIVPYFLWYQSMKPFFGYSAKTANWNPMLVALLFSFAMVVGFLLWALYFGHKAEKPVKVPIVMAAFAAAALTALLTSFPGVPSIFFMCGAALCSASIPVRALSFMYKNLSVREYGLTTCIAIALPTAVLFITLEFVSTGLPTPISTLTGTYLVIMWIASLAVLVGGIMTIVLPAEKVDIKNCAMDTNGAKQTGIFALAVLICFLFTFVTAVQYGMATEVVNKSGQVYEELFLIAVFVAAGMFCDLKGWHITMYVSVAFIIASLVDLLINFNTPGIALSNAGSAAFDAAFLFMFMDISHRFKNTAFILPLGFALPSLVTYTTFLLNILIGQRSDLPMLVIICVFAVALLPLIALLLKKLSTLNFQSINEREPADNSTAETSMFLHNKTTDIGQSTLSLIPDFTERYALTPREAEVLKLTLEGQSAEEMAQSLCITQRTVRAHIGNVLKKIGVKNRLQLISTLLSDSRKQ